ncbi:gluconokinase [Variovorax ureilyticus]|uniref:Gluconokinase n=1 Tax=Variovorax ureilyticus TaxID=1836198 RepID=A0ABU8VB57_9BURK
MTPKILVMGVSGCGKSTVAAHLASALKCPLIEGDDFHLPQSKLKMRRGIPLDDEDRWPWLDRLGRLLAMPGETAVLTCSSLKRAYRDRLRMAVPGLKVVFIEISPEEARERVASRFDHLFPASLVTSQFAALESPIGEPDVLRVEATAAIEQQVQDIRDWLGQSTFATSSP